jgi:hypothetical protein
MHAITDFITSLTINQWALVLGLATWLSHSVLDKNKKLSSELNKFIVRFTSVVFPALTAAAVDPNVTAIVHSYFPALMTFFTAYQGMYFAWTAIAKKIGEIRLQLRLANSAPIAEPVGTEPPTI